MIDENLKKADTTPHASALIESLRDIGYTLSTALADIIDNSITAGASSVHIFADTLTDAPSVAIIDNGSGMDQAELIEALRLGSKNPRLERPSTDLGRFGLGLKSASFSQCRRLTVLSRRNGVMSGARWDLDEIAKSDRWEISLIKEDNNIPQADLLHEDGTLVLWEKLDRVDGGYRHDVRKRTQNINHALAGAERHLRVVFHRFMERKGKGKLSISINSRILDPIDPFATKHPATQIDPEETLTLAQGVVHIRSFTIPHHKALRQDEWDELGGPEGHLRSQGFYIYRGDRLIIRGGWLGLARQTELTKLCRIRVDIPNTMDSDWKIDVKKASAQLPPAVRERLKNIIERFVQTSKRTYRKRGQKLTDETRVPLWQRILKNGEIVYQPNIDHPALAEFEKRLPEDQRRDFRNCIALVGAGLPVDSLHADMLGQAETVKATNAELDALEQALVSMVPHLLGQGVSKEAVHSMMKTTDMFRNEWERVEPVLAKILEQEGME
ncbi:ATP-binding protein [Halomonas sp. ATBC28]|uniref:ATP-binding protein n=1 Tax=Halomonas sp. ATBC28 TaxID=2545264 RepID=UPI001BB1AAB6|nr:ATP-binding protein [Halomonas sp. ATBC28]